MSRTRYFVEHLSISSDRLTQVAEVRKYTRSHHWVRIDNNTIIGYGDFHMGLETARNNPKIALLPALHEKTPIETVLVNKFGTGKSGKSKFAEAMSSKGGNIHSATTTADLLGQMIAMGHNHFEPNI